MGYYVKLVLGLGLFVGGLGLFEVALVKMLQVGTCAEGGAYEIARPCPEGTTFWSLMLPASFIAGFIGFFLFALRGERPGGPLWEPPTGLGFGSIAWALLFVGTGLVCLYARYGSDTELGPGGDLATIILAVTFIPMGIAPLIFGLWSWRDDRSKSRGKRGALTATIFAALGLVLVPQALAAGGEVNAEIRRDTHGIPHIKADDFKGLAFGYGYAFASDNICTIADSYVTVRAERSRYFGPDAGYQQRGNSFPANNLNSDFFFQRINDEGTIEDLLEQEPPLGPKPEIRDGVKGYVAGYNKYLADTGVANLPDPRCRGEEWVKPISEIDVYRRFYQLALLASGTVAIDGIGSSQPPLPDPEAEAGAAPSFSAQKKGEALGEALEDFPAGGIGSNGVGLGSEATDNGKGMVLANPHFPWDGPERFYQSHLTIPGEINVSGGSLYGVPLVLIGHTDNLAWTHTVSTGYRFTPFQEIINPLNPTQYLYDGQMRDMERDRITVMVKTATGLEPRSRTLYSTHHGPIVNGLAGVPLPWTPVVAFTMGDANATNFRYLNHFFEVNKAQSTDELDEVLRRNQGVPWVNTIASDSRGKAYYADISVVPNITDERTLLCNTPLGVVTSALLRLPILNGATSSCEWGDDPDALQDGIFGPSNLPSHFRDDYTSNMNDSYWLSNPEDPIEGYDRIIGDERTPRALRTRLGLKIIEQRLNGSDGLAGNKFTRQQLQDAVFNNRQYAGELWRDQLVTLCQTAPAGFLLGSGGPVNVERRMPGARSLGPPRRSRLERGDPLPPLREPRALLGVRCRSACHCRPATRSSTATSSTSPTRSTPPRGSTSSAPRCSSRSPTPSPISTTRASR